MRVRIIVFCVINTLLYIPILLLVLILSRLKVVGYFFLVSPGSSYQRKAYAPDIIAKLSKLYPWFIDIITPGENGKYGVVFAIKHTQKELLQFRTLKYFTSIMETFAKIAGVPWAFSGSNPSFVRRKHIKTKYMIDGRAGIWSSVRSTIEKAGLSKKQKYCVLGSRGFVGTYIMQSLQRDEYNVIGGVDKGDDKKHVQDADVLIVLTSKGSALMQYENDLSANVVVVDDTHPRVPAKLRNELGHRYVHVAKNIPGIYFVFGLPGFKKIDLPGCVVEAINATRRR